MGKDSELLEASRLGNFALVEKILVSKAKKIGPLASLRRGPGPNVQDQCGNSALHYAAMKGHSDIARLLLSYDANPNLPDNRGSTPLHIAAWGGYHEIVTMLLTNANRPANPNQQTIDLDTPLHCAAQHGHTKVLTTLLATGANADVRNQRDESPLDLAAQYGRLQAVLLLTRANPELIIPLKFECTLSHSPLHLASRNGHKDVVEVLLAAGVYINLQTPNGTALHEAALCGKEAVVRLLLNNGIDIEARDGEGRTALELLQEFPPNVTRNIVSLINNYRNYSMYADDSGFNDHSRMYASFGGNSYDSNRESSHYNSNYNETTTSPSSSMGSLGPPSPTSRHKYSRSMGDAGYVHMRPSGGSKVSPTPPKKPPRRNLSISPTHLDHGYTFTTFEGNNLNNNNNDTTHTLDKRKPESKSKPVALPRNFFLCAPKSKLSSASSSSSTQNNNQTPNHNNNNLNISNNSFKRKTNTYEYLCLAKSGTKAEGQYLRFSTCSNHKNTNNLLIRYFASACTYPPPSPATNKNNLNRGATVDQYLPMNLSADSTAMSTPSSSAAAKLINYENMMVRVPNPKRKLKRQKDNSDSKSFEAFFAPKSDTSTSATTPLSPTHYKQPPTPDHPPPSAQTAERMIYERIRPLSQEYKQRKYMLETGTSPSDFFNKSLGASSGSLSSSVSMSDRSCSTDCVEEYINDMPFAGLFKGSTMNLDNATAFFQTYLNNYKQQMPPPATYQQSQQQEQILLPNRNSRVDITITTNKYTLDDFHHIDTNGDDASSLNGIASIENNGTEEKTSPSSNVISNASKVNNNNDITTDLMSPFNEQEEWAKISEIMESFGSSLDGDKQENGSSSKKLFETPLQKFLNKIGLIHVEQALVDSGFDDVDYLHGVLTIDDMETIGIPDNDRSHLMESIKDLPLALTNADHHKLREEKARAALESKTTNGLTNGSLVPPLTVDQWLADIKLEEYKEVFKSHLYADMERVSKIWEIELQAVLEINKLGHRKRILYSVAERNKLLPPNLEEINGVDSSNDVMSDESPAKVSNGAHGSRSSSHSSASSHSYRKSRPAPKPPIEIRAPDELLLGPSNCNMKTQWRHSASTLVSSSVKYEVFYLGSTVVKELRGTESTRKSIQKLKKGERLATNTTNGDDALNRHQQFNHSRRPVCIAISHRGVQFIDIESQGTICEHEIRNINCACQDAEDLSHFAYITKDSENNTHYCHVFNVDSMSLATEIILTLGQAFEVAYQLALRDASSSTLALRSPSSAGFLSK
ncbi:ankyrin repeat and sterile alpha motif domain-containing protein 1B [Culicoides brevitarsis]|uniref:ankyrin repeat and sterile alpha motif domain-containing protein 1B n=1 Tax=Culicoides brevitarsis TaxID=469753 RepID=UPI00307B66B6